jgi:hypothetical protein
MPNKDDDLTQRNVSEVTSMVKREEVVGNCQRFFGRAASPEVIKH